MLKARTTQFEATKPSTPFAAHFAHTLLPVRASWDFAHNFVKLLDTQLFDVAVVVEDFHRARVHVHGYTSRAAQRGTSLQRRRYKVTSIGTLIVRDTTSCPHAYCFICT